MLCWGGGGGVARMTLHFSTQPDGLEGAGSSVANITWGKAKYFMKSWQNGRVYLLCQQISLENLSTLKFNALRCCCSTFPLVLLSSFFYTRQSRLSFSFIHIWIIVVFLCLYPSLKLILSSFIYLYFPPIYLSLMPMKQMDCMRLCSLMPVAYMLRTWSLRKAQFRTKSLV